MKRILSCILLSTLGWQNSFASVVSGADKLINQVSPNVNIGIQVVDLTTGATLYKRNQSKFFIPASNMKLYSDAAALMVLGPDYRFKNQLSIGPSQIRQGVLKGNIYLHLSGDPSFSHKRLATLLQSLVSLHINKIQGNVIIDSSHAIASPYAPGIMTQDLAYSYGAPLAPVMVDANRIVITVNPADQAGKPATVEVDDEGSSIVVDNQVKTKERGARCGVGLVLDTENHLTARGCVAVGQWAIQQKLAIRNPLRYAQGLVRQSLNRVNIVLEGSVALGRTPTGAMLFNQDRSKPIAQLMADTLKPSDNLYADSLFLHAAEKLTGTPVNWAEAQVAVKQFLSSQTGIDLKNAVLTDGSGLSRNDLVTAEQTVMLLRFLYERFPLAYEYIAALPVSGRDGTLQRRFKRPDQQDLVRAKTGTMTGVIGLSGYLYTANSHTLAFAIFINNVRGTPLSVSGKYRYLVDALCSYFLQQKPSSTSWSRMFSAHGRVKYQMNPTQAEVQRGRQARWRRLESVIKQGLRGQAVTVLYRNNELILNDNQADAGTVLATLSNLRKKYPFAASLSSPAMPTKFTSPLMLWTEASILPANAKRVWVIRESL